MSQEGLGRTQMTIRVPVLALAILAPMGVSQAGQMGLTTGAPVDYPRYRIQQAFDLTSELVPSAPVTVPLAKKGDLQLTGCTPSVRLPTEVACLEALYGQKSRPYFIVERRGG